MTAMLGDGKTAYDHDHDNEKTEVRLLIVGCVRVADMVMVLRSFVACRVFGKTAQLSTCLKLIASLPGGCEAERSRHKAEANIHERIEKTPSPSSTLTLPFRHVLISPLQLALQVDEWNKWKVCFEVPDFTMPQGEIYLGFSALTGDVSDAHE